MPPSVAAATEAGGAREAAIFGGFGRGFSDSVQKAGTKRMQVGRGAETADFFRLSMERSDRPSASSSGTAWAWPNMP
jgi:hypothetical protein